MCFRPAEAAAPKECAKCGKLVIADPDGMMPEVCPDCGGALAEKVFVPGGGAPAVAAPSAPIPPAPGKM